MKSIFIYFFILVCSLLLPTPIQGQENNYQRAKDFQNTANYDSSAVYYTKALNDFSKNELKKAEILLNRGSLYKSMSKYDFALGDYLSAQKIYKSKNNQNGVALTDVNLAELYRHLANYTEAKNYIGLAEKLLKKSSVSSYTKAYFYNRKAAIIAETANAPKEVLRLSQKAIALSQKDDFPEIEVSSLNQLGYLFNHDTVGLNYYKKALSILQKHQDIRTEVDVLINISRFYQLNGGPYDKGIEYVDQGLELCEGKDWYLSLKELHHIKASCYHMMQDYIQANAELVFVLDYTEKLLNAKFGKELQEVETKYNVSQKEALLQSEKDKSSLLENQNSSQRKYLIATIVIVVLLILIVTISIYAYWKIRQSNKDLSISNHQKDVLIQEVHHRVKNNFQMVSGLMQMQLRTISDESSKKMLEEASARIHSMALIHQQLYSNDHLDQIAIKEFLTDILQSLAHSDLRSQDFYSIHGDNPLIHIEQAIPLGMIIHELTTNSIKYAWEEDAVKRITVQIACHHPTLTLTYSDNGKGLPSDFNLQNTKSLGLKLIDLFIQRQLKGTVSHSNDSGATFIFTFDLR